MARHLWLPLVALVALGSTAHADVKSGEALFRKGEYAKAIADWKGVKGKEAGRASVRLGRAYLRTGDLPGAEAAATAAMKDKDAQVAADATVLLAEVHRERGKLAEARALLEPLTRKQPRHLRARVQLGLVYLAIGENGKAKATFDTFYDDWRDDKIDQKDAEQLMYVALAARWIEGYHDANDTFRDAVDRDPALLEANIEWGWLFLEKYDAGDAEQCFDEVLKQDANHPDALTGLARVKLEQNYDARSAHELLDRALQQNPNHAHAQAIRAELFIDNSQYAEAQKLITRLLAQNPVDQQALALRGAIAFLTDDKPGYEAARKAALKANPRDPRFYHVVAEFAVRAHRYDEAIALEEQALKVDPTFADALQGIGTGYLRMGIEDKGVDYLRRAWDRDTFNVRTFNQLELFEKTIPKEYEFTTSKHFKLRMHVDERQMLSRYVPQRLERAFADMARRYGFAPKAPVVIELFADPQWYSVRTVGLPNLAALGVCFGQVITAMSPSVGNFNWAMVLWHELGHVFAIQRSKSRVPRWFTEGLSEYETILARPEWRRENDLDVYLAMQAGRLPSVVELNSQFLLARDLGDMTVAYHMSSLAIEFIATRYGFARIVAGLDLYAAGKTDAEVIKGITGLEPAAFDAEFKKHLTARFAAYQKGFHVRPGDFGDVAALDKALAAAPRDAGAMADLALGHLFAGDVVLATDLARRALTQNPRQPRALWVQATLASAQGTPDPARTAWQALIAAGGDGYDARVALGKLAKDADAARLELDRAKAFDPQRAEPWALAAQQFKKAGREDDFLRELEGFAHIEQMDGDALEVLVNTYLARKNWPKVVTWGERAIDVLPFSGPMHLALGLAYVEVGRAPEALYELESALLARPVLPRPAVAHVGMARAAMLKKDLKAARKAVEAALKAEPRNAEALELKGRLK
jgi:tetratricopeptide (TPR) repeat protein